MTPPRLPRKLVELLVDSRLADAVLGDLEEIFAGEARRSLFRAHLRYWQRAAGVLWHLRHAREPHVTSPRLGDRLMTTILRDFARGSRLFVTQPAFAWAAVVTLALAIGANTLIFTIANVLVVKPLPFDDPDRLGWILTTVPGSTVDRAGVSLPEYAAFREEVTAFTRLAAWRRQPVTLRERDHSERVMAQEVIGDLQGVWGLTAVRGRTLSAGDERPGAPRVAVVSHRFWQTRFGGADDIVGRSLIIDGQPSAVVGVLTPAIELGNVAEIDVWLPTAQDPISAARTERGWRPVGRLGDGATLADAHAQAAAVAARLEREHPDTNRDWTVRVGTTRDALAGTNTWLVLSLLALVVGLLLLLACANVMNLLIARLIGRRQELAVRTALGATRAQVVRQVLAESLMLGLAGGALGLLVGWGGLRGIHAISAEPFFQQLSFDLRVILFAVVLSFVAPLVFSVLPTLRVLRDDVRTTLSEGSTRSVGSAAAARGRSGLVVLQVSVAVTLLIVAALAVQSMQAIIAADPGYDPAKLLTAQADIASWKTPDDDDALRLRQQVIARVRELPGVEGVTLASRLPAMQFAPQVTFDVRGAAAVEERDRPRAGLTTVTTGYFTVLDVPILAGRDFVAADAAAGRAVAIVSAETARRFWGAPDRAVGAVIRVARAGQPPLEAGIIGVSRNITDPDLPDVPTPAIYVLDEHLPSRAMYVIVRAAAPATLATPLRIATAEVDPDLPLFQLRTMTAAMADENSSNVLLSGLFASFALTAILLAMAGLYGVMSYAVSQRSGEIAVRLALGAPARAIARQVVGQSVRLAACGIALGVLGAYGLARAMAAILFGVTAADPLTYAAAVLLTLTLSVAASWLPMRRAASIDPLDSLRRT